MASPQRPVTLYIDNRLDGAVEVNPDELAAEFIAAIDGGGYDDSTQRASVEYAYRWWLSGPDGRSASWDESDWDAIADALAHYLADKPEIKSRLWKKVCP